jgi:hypothetical protein
MPTKPACPIATHWKRELHSTITACGLAIHGGMFVAHRYVIDGEPTTIDCKNCLRKLARARDLLQGGKKPITKGNATAAH